MEKIKNNSNDLWNYKTIMIIVALMIVIFVLGFMLGAMFL
jgi:hypothetical protein